MSTDIYPQSFNSISNKNSNLYSQNVYLFDFIKKYSLEDLYKNISYICNVYPSLSSRDIFTVYLVESKINISNLNMTDLGIVYDIYSNANINLHSKYSELIKSTINMNAYVSDMTDLISYTNLGITYSDCVVDKCNFSFFTNFDTNNLLQIFDDFTVSELIPIVYIKYNSYFYTKVYYQTQSSLYDVINDLENIEPDGIYIWVYHTQTIKISLKSTGDNFSVSGVINSNANIDHIIDILKDHIKFNGISSLHTYNYKFTFSVQNVDLDLISFADFILNGYYKSQLFVCNEEKKTFLKKKKIYLISKYELSNDHIMCGISFSTTTPHELHFHISNVQTEENCYKFQRVVYHLLSKYLTVKNNILKTQYKFKFSLVMDTAVKEYSQKEIKQKQKKTGKRIDMLKNISGIEYMFNTELSSITTQHKTYSSKCQPPRQPLHVYESDLPQNHDPDKYINFTLDSKHYFTCDDENQEYQYPGILNKTVKKNETQDLNYAPCCFKNPQTSEGNLYHDYVTTIKNNLKNLPVKQASTRILAPTTSAADVGGERLGKLPIFINSLFENLGFEKIEKHSQSILRVVRSGTTPSKISALTCLKKAVAFDIQQVLKDLELTSDNYINLDSKLIFNKICKLLKVNIFLFKLGVDLLGDWGNTVFECDPSYTTVCMIMYQSYSESYPYDYEIFKILSSDVTIPDTYAFDFNVCVKLMKLYQKSIERYTVTQDKILIKPISYKHVYELPDDNGIHGYHIIKYDGKMPNIVFQQDTVITTVNTHEQFLSYLSQDILPRLQDYDIVFLQKNYLQKELHDVIEILKEFVIIILSLKI